MRSPAAVHPRSLVALAAVAAVIVLLGATLAVRSATAATRRPACTQSALQAGVARARGLRVVRPFGCDGAWAFAAVLIGTHTGHEVEGTVVLDAHGTRWVAVSREQPCARHEIPRRIYRDACETN